MEVVYHRDALEGAAAAEFDQFVANAGGGHFMQTRAWAPLATIGRQLFPRYVLVRNGGKLVGAALVLRPMFRGLRAPWAIMERGPVTQRPEQVGEVADAIAKAGVRHGIVRWDVQPYWSGADGWTATESLRARGFNPEYALDGPHTQSLRLDLNVAKTEDLFAGDKIFGRNKRQAEKLGARSARGTAADLPVFARLYGELMAQQGKGAKSDAWFAALRPLLESETAAIFRCNYEGDVTAVVLVVRHGAQVTFHLGASTSRKLPFQKMILPLFDAVDWARTAGARVFDLGGVPEEIDLDEKRNSIAQFKFRFTRNRVAFTRPHVRYLWQRP